MWKRAVWIEDGVEEEGVIPDCWADEKSVFWPPGKNAIKALKERREPSENWGTFPLVKVKCVSGMVACFCFAFNIMVKQLILSWRLLKSMLIL